MKNSLQKILLFISITLLLLFYFAFVFLYQKINDNNQKTQQTTISLQKESNRRDDIASIDRATKKIFADRILLESHFIKSSDVVPFLNTIEKLAKESGVLAQINSVNTKTDNTELTVDLKASGRFEAIFKFLTLLENSPYLLDFISMDMQKLSSLTEISKNINNSNWGVVFKIKLLSFVP